MKIQEKSSNQLRALQAGFSLIELMIAIVIAMVVTAGAIAVFGNMRSTYTTQDKLGQLQDSQRLALTILTTTVQQAGYFVNPQKNTGLPVGEVNRDKSKFDDGIGLVGTSGANVDASDILNIRFQSSPGDGLMNCKGEMAGAAVVTWVNTFEVSNNQLTCRINGGDPLADSFPLIDNVSAMKVNYLVDVGLGNYQYMDAAAVQKANKWAGVLSAQITISFVNTLTDSPKTIPIVQNISLMNKL